MTVIMNKTEWRPFFFVYDLNHLKLEKSLFKLLDKKV